MIGLELGEMGTAMEKTPLRKRSAKPCPRCRRLISVDAQACIHCGLKRPNVYRTAPLLKHLLSEQISFVQPILVSCIALYLLALGLDFSSLDFSGGIFNILSPTTEVLFDLGAGGVLPASLGRWWTMLTATYLHGSLLHIAFNMMWLLRLGSWVEELFGKSRFWIIYTVAGLFGSIVSTLAGTFLFVGASGAIFGLFGALLFYGRHRGGTFGSALFRQMLIWVVIAFVLGFTVSGIDNWGHLGGLVGGFAAAWLLKYQERRREGLYDHLAAFVLIFIVLLCFVLMIANYFLK